MEIVNDIRKIYKYRKANDKLSIEVPSKKNWGAIIFISFWQCGWLLGYVLAWAMIISGDLSLFLFFWLFMWTIGGIFSFCVVLWMVFGKEILIIRNNNSVNYRCIVLGFNLKKQIFYDNIKRVSMYSHKGHFFTTAVYILPENHLRIGFGLKDYDCNNISETINKYIQKNTQNI